MFFQRTTISFKRCYNSVPSKLVKQDINFSEVAPIDHFFKYYVISLEMYSAFNDELDLAERASFDVAALLLSSLERLGQRTMAQ